MPELPEVETVRQSLIPHVLNKEIASVQVLYPRVFPKQTIDEGIARLTGEELLDIRRRGKYLIFLVSNDIWMIIHLRMTGQLLYVQDGSLPLAKHTSFLLEFKDGSHIRFVDQRKFGTVYVVDEGDVSEITGLRTLGPEPLSDQFTPRVLRDMLARDTKIKAVLLDQKRIAGLGNIYADEALYRAHIHPNRPASSLEVEEIERLYLAINEVLTEGIRFRGTTIKDFRSGYGEPGEFQKHLRVYGKRGEPCSLCGSLIERVRVAGRSSHYCPTCQKEG